MISAVFACFRKFGILPHISHIPATCRIKSLKKPAFFIANSRILAREIKDFARIIKPFCPCFFREFPHLQGFSAFFRIKSRKNPAFFIAKSRILARKIKDFGPHNQAIFPAFFWRDCLFFKSRMISW